MKRILDDPYYGGGRIRFTEWPGLDEHEKICAQMFEDALDRSMNEFPPDVSLVPVDESGEPTVEKPTDVDVVFSLNAGEDDGPTWNFSLRETLTETAEHCNDDEREGYMQSLASVLRRLANYCESSVTGHGGHACASQEGRRPW